MKNWINYHHLFYFKTIAEEGSVSKAAEKLRLGQPTLSAQLKQLEESLEIELFERQHRRLALTEQGKIALDYAKNIFTLGSEMYEALHDRLKPSRPSLHIAALDSIPKQVVVQLVQKAQKIANCQITLTEGSFDELLRELMSHRADLLVTNFLPTGLDAKGLYPKKVTKKPVAFFGIKEFKPLRKNFPQSLSRQPVILPTYDSQLRFDIEHWAKIHHLDLDVVVESQDIAVKKLLAISGLGIMPTATHTVSRQVLAGELVELGKIQGIYEELFLVSAERKIANPVAAKLLKTFNV